VFERFREYGPWLENTTNPISLSSGTAGTSSWPSRNGKRIRGRSLSEGTSAPVLCIVTAHGFGGTKVCGLDRYACPGQILGAFHHCLRFPTAGPSEATRYARGRPLTREPPSRITTSHGPTSPSKATLPGRARWSHRARGGSWPSPRSVVSTTDTDAPPELRPASSLWICHPTTRRATFKPAQRPQGLSENPDRWLPSHPNGPSLAGLRRRLRAEMTLLTGTGVHYEGTGSRSGSACRLESPAWEPDPRRNDAGGSG
jgi:hypothetical protein